MTEEEAKKKWCPFFAVSGCIGPSDDLGVVTNRPDDFQAAFCVGSKCMAWRATDHEVGPTPPNERGVIEYKPAGYCGLAGKP